MAILTHKKEDNLFNKKSTSEMVVLFKYCVNFIMVENTP